MTENEIKDLKARFESDYLDGKGIGPIIEEVIDIVSDIDERLRKLDASHKALHNLLKMS